MNMARQYNTTERQSNTMLPQCRIQTYVQHLQVMQATKAYRNFEFHLVIFLHMRIQYIPCCRSW